MSRYNFKTTETKWQRIWEERACFEVDQDPDTPKYYVMEMFPYPSGRIHMGHVRNYTLGRCRCPFQARARFQRAAPDGVGCVRPAGGKRGLRKWRTSSGLDTRNIAAMRAQLKSMGLSLDWSREFATCDPEYYEQGQRLFLAFLQAGLAYRKESWVNWDPVENSVLANEQVIDGKGWRTGAPVEKRLLSQWFFKITDFSEDLLGALGTLDGWPEKVRLMQRNWIGRSEGARVRFNLSNDETLEVFTTRPDTLFGASFCAVSPNHPLAQALADDNPAVADFIAECNRSGTSEAEIETAEKKGVDTGLTADHPFDDTIRLPIYIANFVLMEYGTGAIFGCPAHDQRDLDFARKYDLAVTPVVLPPDTEADGFVIGDEAFTDDGIAINSGFLDGLGVADAKKAAIARLVEDKRGDAEVSFRLRDWGISRQRYWGCPIPVIHCDDCGTVPVPDADLPVLLPEDVTFDQPGNPLDRHPDWKHTSCPCCGKPATRETDTCDTLLRFILVFRPLLFAELWRRTVRPGRRRLLASGGSIYRRHRTRGTASALCALFHQGAAPSWHANGG